MKSNRNADKKKNEIPAGSYFWMFLGLVPIGLLLLHLYFSGVREEKQMLEHGVDTECVMVAYDLGRTGVRGPKSGYINKFEYQIGLAKYNCYVFTSRKPLPIGLKLNVRYLKSKDGQVRINFPDDYKQKYKAYGFNDYGY